MLFLVLEFMRGGDLHETRLARPSKCYTEEETRFITAEITLALSYLHSLNINFRGASCVYISVLCASAQKCISSL